MKNPFALPHGDDRRTSALPLSSCPPFPLFYVSSVSFPWCLDDDRVALRVAFFFFFLWTWMRMVRVGR